MECASVLMLLNIAIDRYLSIRWAVHQVDRVTQTNSNKQKQTQTNTNNTQSHISTHAYIHTHTQAHIRLRTHIPKYWWNNGLQKVNLRIFNDLTNQVFIARSNNIKNVPAFGLIIKNIQLIKRTKAELLSNMNEIKQLLKRRSIKSQNAAQIFNSAFKVDFPGWVSRLKLMIRRLYKVIFRSMARFSIVVKRHDRKLVILS